MMSSRQLKEATAVFKLVTEIYPDSWNAYDSYGEALLKSGQQQEAIRMYQQSVTLNPDNTNGKKILERLHQ
jgi:Flp pilus assembly protein TadD